MDTDDSAVIEPASAPIGVVLVEPLRSLREAIRELVTREEDLEVTATPTGLEETVRETSTIDGRGVVVIGLAPNSESEVMELIRTLSRPEPSVPVLAYGAGTDRLAVSQALLCGADGYVDLGVEPERYVDAIRRVAAGGLVIEGLSKARGRAVPDRVDLTRAEPPRLSVREREVLSLIAEGLTARQVALRLGLKERTVTTHLSRIYRKLGASGRIDAVRIAVRANLIGAGR